MCCCADHGLCTLASHVALYKLTRSAHVAVPLLSQQVVLYTTCYTMDTTMQRLPLHHSCNITACNKVYVSVQLMQPQVEPALFLLGSWPLLLLVIKLLNETMHALGQRHTCVPVIDTQMSAAARPCLRLCWAYCCSSVELRLQSSTKPASSNHKVRVAQTAYCHLVACLATKRRQLCPEAPAL